MATGEGPNFISCGQAFRCENVLPFVQPFPIGRIIQAHRFLTAGLDEPSAIAHDVQGASGLQKLQASGELQALQRRNEFDLIIGLCGTGTQADPLLPTRHKHDTPPSLLALQGTIGCDQSGLWAHTGKGQAGRWKGTNTRA